MQEIKQEEGAGGNNVLMVGVGMLVVGLVVGFLFGWYWHKSGDENALVESNVNNNATSTELVAASSTSTAPVPQNLYNTVSATSSVSVVDQRAGNLVFIQHIDASVPTWVAVRDVTNGAIGNILGAEMITTTTDDLPITLLRSTKAGEQYAVFLYQEDGDGRFDFKKDALVMQNNTPVSAMFTAQ